jgi:hypothetical protein
MQHLTGMRGVLSRTLLALLLIAALACDSDDDSPTQPPSRPADVAGLWNGTFSPAGSPAGGGTALVAMELAQSGRLVTGSVAVGGLTWALEGSVDSLGRLEWDTTGATCGSFDGRTVVDRARVTMIGDAELNRFACPEGRRRDGDLILQKIR